ncbi:MAG: hypothetical protein HDQ98_08545 [Lachnospiraceae bacterium]|nr:hypothetical protein [Lachnospiraceae bacterium]
MEMNLTNSVNFAWQYQRAPQKAASQKTKNPMTTGNAAQTGSADRTQGAGFTLHIGSGDNADRMLSAVAGRGKGGMTVFEPADFNPEQPMYKVCTWDLDGNMTERMVDLTKVDAHNSDEAEMFAYSCYLSDSGQYKEAADTFMRTRGYLYENVSDKDMDTEPADALATVAQTKRDWTKLAALCMQMQYDGGNLKGYLEYKKFVDFFG